MKRPMLIILLLVAYGILLLIAWNLGPYILELPVMTGYWVMMIGVGLLCGIPIGIFTVLNLRRSQVEDRRAQKLCIHCGYDLRAHKAGERCPECGIEIL